jgi:glycosyltransferase involved in cell wall biosynthesis
MKKMKIIQVAPLWFTIPPGTYGGIERIVSLLADGLVAKGHEVKLYAAPGSESKAEIVSVYDKPLIKAGISWNNPFWNLENLAEATEEAASGKYDIVHSHLDVWALFFQGISQRPFVHTMHNPLYRTNADATKDDRLRLFTKEANRTNIAFISESARKQAMIDLPHSRVIYNGIDTDHFKFGEGGDHFVWIARINKHKGIENAIAAAEKIGARLTLAGRVDDTQQEYLETVIKPHLNDKITYIGELNQSQLPGFYGSATALLYPIEWEEPFGLVVAEAMSCGTPVIAYRRGSMPELIEDGKTGFVIDSDVDLLAEKMKEIGKMDRAYTREHVIKNFSEEKMIDEYEKFYLDILNNG